jgi:protein tyrosine/serine phosphatase
MEIKTAFPVSWVLVNELALGPAPRATRHLDKLEAEGITSVLSLCSTKEIADAEGMDLRFHCQRVVLPEQRTNGLLSLDQLEQALAALSELRNHGPVFVHCLAAIERAPLVCQAWLMRQHGLSRQHALDYLRQVHPRTSPSASQLMLLNQLDHDAAPTLKIA